MMWSYYGGKSKLIDHYPPPKEGLIIEPFAGSARYALKYWDRDVLLVDKFDKIVKIWQYLINATREDILSLPNIDNGLKDSVDNYNIIDEEKWLIGFNINSGSASPKNLVVVSIIGKTKKLKLQIIFIKSNIGKFKKGLMMILKTTKPLGMLTHLINLEVNITDIQIKKLILIILENGASQEMDKR